MTISFSLSLRWFRQPQHEKKRLKNLCSISLIKQIKKKRRRRFAWFLYHLPSRINLCYPTKQKPESPSVNMLNSKQVKSYSTNTATYHTHEHKHTSTATQTWKMHSTVISEQYSCITYWDTWFIGSSDICWSCSYLCSRIKATSQFIKHLAFKKSKKKKKTIITNC